MKDLEIELINSLEILKSYARYYSINNYEADDLLGDTVLRILEKRDQYKKEMNFIGWCVVIMKSIYFNNLKSNEIRRTENIDNYLNISIYDENDVDDFLKNSLTEKLFNCFKLYYDGYDYESISNKLNIPIGTVKSRINSARKILKKLI